MLVGAFIHRAAIAGLCAIRIASGKGIVKAANCQAALARWTAVAAEKVGLKPR